MEKDANEVDGDKDRAKEQSFRKRILSKFYENKMEKIERLVEHHEKYYDKVKNPKQANKQ